MDIAHPRRNAHAATRLLAVRTTEPMQRYPQHRCRSETWLCSGYAPVLPGSTVKLLKRIGRYTANPIRGEQYSKMVFRPRQAAFANSGLLSCHARVSTSY